MLRLLKRNMQLIGLVCGFGALPVAASAADDVYLRTGATESGASIGVRDWKLIASAVPDPKLPPDEVVKLQIEALRHNDDTDRGIAVAFRFASPSNKLSTGPLPRFASMIRNGAYRLMLDYAATDYGEVEVVGNNARLRVTLVRRSEIVSYVFYLSKQSQEPFVDCWMTDAVTLEPTDKTQV